MRLLCVSNLSFAPFRGVSATSVQLSFELSSQAGVVPFYGPPGSGVTTLFQQLAGKHGSGGETIQIGSRTVDQLAESDRRISYFEIPREWPTISVVSWMRERLPGIDPGEAETQIRAALDAMGLNPTEFLQRTPQTNLSGLQRVCVAIARALLGNTEVVLFDRIFDHFSPAQVSFIVARLRRAAREKDLVVAVATSRADIAYLLGCHLAVLNGGRLEAIGPRHELFERPATPTVAAALSPLGFNVIPGTLSKPAGDETRFIFQGPFGLKLPVSFDTGAEPEFPAGASRIDYMMGFFPWCVTPSDPTRADEQTLRISPDVVEVFGDPWTCHWTIQPYGTELPRLVLTPGHAVPNFADPLHHPREICIRVTSPIFFPV